MRKAGVPETVIMAITGHSTREMFDRYDTVDAEDAQRAIGQFGDYLKTLDKTLDKSPKIKKGARNSLKSWGE